MLAEILTLLLSPFERRVVTRELTAAFYKSRAWAQLRYQAIKRYGPQCGCCGSTSRIVVDHIRPVRTHWHLRLKLSNLQILCSLCNRGKGSHDRTDWR
jgi:5-methylcytosine-specific restriction endonuclease McrA